MFYNVVRINAWLGIVFLVLTGGSDSFAEVLTDGSVGIVENLSGPNFQVRAELGRQNGSNLFHSFSQFNLSNGESVVFTGSPLVENIISRVTGGDPSSINGEISSTIPEVNLFLLNPAGIMFGREASINIDGSFHVGSANSIVFADGSEFHADTTISPSFTTASPVAFGFLGNQAGEVSLEGTELTLSSNEQLTLVGESINSEGGELQRIGFRFISPNSRLEVPDGRVVIASVESNSTISIADGALQLNDDTTYGDVSLNQTEIDTSGNDGGITEILANTTRFENTLITGDSIDSDTGALVMIGSDTSLVISESIISTNSTGTSPAGTVRIHGGDVALLDGSSINNSSQDGGEGGVIDIDISGTLNITGGFFTRSDISSRTVGSGDGGIIRINAQSVDASRGSISTATGGEFTGQDIPGGIEINALESITLIDTPVFTIGVDDRSSGTISLNTPSLDLNASSIVSLAGNADSEIGLANSGHITIISDVINFSGRSTNGRGSIDISTETSGSGGNLFITANDVSLTDGAFISSTSSSEGAGGNLVLEAENLQLNDQSSIRTSTLGSGSAASLSISASDVSFNDGAFISSTTSGAGAGGSIVVEAETLQLNSGSSIDTNTFGSGNAGSIQLDLNALMLNGFSDITVQTNGDGDGGEITIFSELVEIAGFSSIRSLTRNNGNGGDVRVDSNLFTLDGRISIQSTGIGNNSSLYIMSDELQLRGGFLTSDNEGSGQGGVFSLSVEEISLENSFISTSTSGEGSASDISIVGDNVTIIDSDIRSTTSSSGVGGEVFIDLGRNLILNESSNIQTTPRSTGNAGNIVIRTGNDVILENVNDGRNSISSTTINGGGDTGDVTITAGGSVRLNGGGNSIRTEANGFNAGAAGDITLNVSGDLELLSGMNEVLSQTLSDFNAGNIFISAGGAIRLAEGFFNRITSATFSSGFGGAITLSAANISIEDNATITSVVVGGRLLPDFFIPFDGSGNTGFISLTADNISLLSGGTIATQTGGTGSAGNIDIISNEIFISGQTEEIIENDIFINGQSEIQPSRILLNSPGAGDGGTLRLSANILRLENNAVIDGSAGFMGRPGNLFFNVGQFTIDNAFLNASVDTIEQSDIDNVGGINIQGTNLTLLNGAFINANSLDVGDGGNINIVLSGGLTLMSDDLSNQDFRSTISVDTFGSGRGGVASISADNVILENSIISSTANDTGEAGLVSITANQASLNNNALVTSQAFSTGNSGILELNLNEILMLESGSLLSTETINSGGGVIDVNARVIFISDSVINADNFEQGGDIRLTPELLVINENSLIRANVELGQGGNIAVDAAFFLSEGAPIDTFLDASSSIGPQLSGIELNLGNSLVAANTRFFDDSTLVASPCLSRNRLTSSSFKLLGSGGIPQLPDSLQLANFYKLVSNVGMGYETNDEVYSQIALLRNGC